jgi:hypothetical protein
MQELVTTLPLWTTQNKQFLWSLPIYSIFNYSTNYKMAVVGTPIWDKIMTLPWLAVIGAIKALCLHYFATVVWVADVACHITDFKKSGKFPTFSFFLLSNLYFLIKIET